MWERFLSNQLHWNSGEKRCKVQNMLLQDMFQICVVCIINLPGLTQTRLYSHRRQIEAGNLKTDLKRILYYPCSENKGADQLHVYREADLRLCFRICKMLVFS